ncbi:SDR family NAD(P)-dependent oxidoreductase [Streptomyces capillispiralis]|uniref:3-oxoacyl-[acyl-carrier-protein] reductase n=1 Tax=Streptomyces capillispiralis TaxID=68182 RepID=A0A561TCC4_9ACTN|nr:SDR family oxidoreductase [Streptomyces capillispiralis]TWF84765.1 3-oxoacyl-[acyl-carrier-protein] reductase [Streptomyces capillispiralis]GHH96130.1 3-oxoacyl-[acyl-carrier-protein] reductase FabG [Streptomyces capillispiralis]
MKLKDRAALVTGGSRGIGRAVALALAEQGAAVAVNYRTRAEDAAAVVKEIEAAGGRAVAVGADVSDPGAAAGLAEEAARLLGGLHILVNNAGVSDDGLLHTVAADAWWRVMKVNFGGAYHCTHAVVGRFMAQGDGTIVNISSAMGERGWIGQSNYSASKGALNAFTRSSAIELARFGIRVNAVLAGFTPTELVGEVLHKDGGRGIKRQVPLRRFATVEEVAAAAAFLAGPDSAYTTGELLAVDGGFSAQLGTGRP